MLNLHDLYSAGVNRGRYGPIINPVRRVIWKLCRPYFERLLNQQPPDRIASIASVEVAQVFRELRRTTDAQAHRIKMLEKIIDDMQENGPGKK
jgi:hypothetical protein